jgi:protein-disulfide isomerase
MSATIVTAARRRRDVVTAAISLPKARILNCRIKPLLWLIAMASQVSSLPALAEGIQLITAEGQKAMLAAPGTEPVGAADADVTIVEYFDYNCPYCKKMAPVFEGLLKEDHHVRIFYKDWPILGDMSVYGAKAVLAAQWQHKYRVAHDALINGPRLTTTAQVDADLSRVGINLDTLSKDRAKHSAEIAALIERNDEEAHALNLRGTPGIVVGRQLLPGIVDLGDLKRLVAETRNMK